MVAAAERFAEEFATGASAQDRLGTFAIEHLDKLRADGFLVGFVPVEFGGGGGTSVHDILVASSRLARGDVATTIGVNMHFAVILNIVRGWRVAVTSGANGHTEAGAAMLRRVVAEDIVFASAVSESAPQDLTRPRTTAVRTTHGWLIDGDKVFATMASAATIVNTAVSYRAADGSERYGFALVPASAPGVTFNDDWDALGMRASASGSMSLRGVKIDADAVRDGFATGSFSAAFFERYLASGVPRRGIARHRRVRSSMDRGHAHQAQRSDHR
jgi:alkylation response protein AidB-like acyl-CoA dehydrogenase